MKFTCSRDNHATVHTYPRATDPIFDNSDAAVSGTSADGFSKHLTVTRSGSSFTVNVTGNSSGTPSAAEYIRDTLAPSNGTYGWFRGYFASDISEEFPLHELRAPSMSETLCCLIKVRMKDIETGIKLSI